MTKPDRLDLRTVAEADVYLGDDLAAHLVRESADTISFNYIAEERPTEAGIRARSVSWSLLRSREYPVVTTGGASMPVSASACGHGQSSQ
jgi:serine/threonine-protein kinase HipA